jgi:hypothetical protein
LEALDKTYPNAPQIEYRLALAYLRDNNSSDGIAELKKAIAHKPGVLEAILMLADFNLRNGNPQDVISAMVELLKQQSNLTAGPSVPQSFRLTSSLSADRAALLLVLSQRSANRAWQTVRTSINLGLGDIKNSAPFLVIHDGTRDRFGNGITFSFASLASRKRSMDIPSTVTVLAPV